MTNQNTVLPEQTDENRLAVFKMLTAACTHLYSKAKLQRDKFDTIAPTFAKLCKEDPIFMAHLSAWSTTKDSKDLRTLSIFFNWLNDANGQPFFPGSKTNKPNFRAVSSALLQNLDPHSALRILELCHLKFAVSGLLNEGRHFPNVARTAFTKYLHYREGQPQLLNGIKKAGLGRKLREIYVYSHVAPSDEAAAILGWKQKDGRNIELQKLPDFSSMTSQEIADKLKEIKLAPQVALSVIPQEKITVKVAEALLTNATGNQAIILYNWFSRNGFLDVEGIKKLFKDKVQTSTTAIDRIDTLTKNAAAEDKKEMAEVRSQKRKSTARTADIGKIFVHIDTSGSMQAAINFAMEKGAIIAECIQNPSENFAWGTFNTNGNRLPLPKGFTKEDFYQALYGTRAGGSTDCVALYQEAREFGAEVDIYISDSGHNVGAIMKRINDIHTKNPNYKKPRAAIIVDFAPSVMNLEDGLKGVGIPVARITPNSLNESALVAQSVRNALVGELAIIEEIMNVSLPLLPKWWNEVGRDKQEAIA